MATIKFDSLSKPIVSTKHQGVFSDIHLDIVRDTQATNGYNSKNSLPDVKLDYDLDAIKNSLVNLFNTVPGQNLMIPEFGLNLNQFLFRPISDIDARFIGNTILNGVNTYKSP